MKSVFVLFVSVVLLSSCKTASSVAGGKDNGKIDVTFLQINDVYEIAPLGGGKEGGLARVATLKKDYRQKNPNTFLVMAGDFVSPSIYNSLQYNGKAVRGRQMVEALNAAGLDYAVFGNHEFDIRESELQERINESDFAWISTNAFHKTKSGAEPFVKEGRGPLAKTVVLTVRDADGTTAKIGLVGLTGPFNRADYVEYTDVLKTAKEAYDRLKDSADAVIAITHQSMDADELLARELPGLTAIIGGHEHDGRYEKIGAVPITKAVANAKNAYVVNLFFNKKKNQRKVKTSTVTLNEAVPLDSAANLVVQKWNKIADENYSSLGFDARAVVMDKGEPLEGRETPVRSRPTNLTQLIVASIKDAAPQADVVVMNGGSIRVDDVLQLPLTQYDVLRTLPFGGAINEADIKGSLLVKTLEAGRKNIGSGGFLQYSENLSFANDKWLLNSQPIDPTKTYRVALPEFLLTGKEGNMDFLNPTNVDVVKVYPAAEKSDPRFDIRLAVVRYLEKNRAQYMR